MLCGYSSRTENLSIQLDFLPLAYTLANGAPEPLEHPSLPRVEHLLRKYGGGLDVRAIQAFDIALYGPNLAPGDCVVAISHRGTKRYTARALERARAPGCRTALVTGEGGSGHRPTRSSRRLDRRSRRRTP